MFKNLASQKIALFAFDVTTGLGKAGDAANLTAYVNKDWAGVNVLADTSATEIDSTNAKGWYLFDVAQAESNGDALNFTGKSTTSNISVVGQLIYTFPTTGILAPATAGRTLVVDGSGLADANMVKAGPTGSGTAQTARDIGASVLLSAGTGTGQLDFTSGVIKANLVQILATALTETAGLLAGGFKKFFNVASPTLTCLDVNQTGDAYARLGAPAGASVSADVAAVKVDTAAVKVQTDKLAFTVANQVDSNVIDWKGSTAPAMTGDAYARLGAPAGASVSADIAAVKSVDDAVKAKTDNLPASPAAVGSAMALTSGERNSVADALLARNITGGSSTGRTVSQSFASLRNRWQISGGVLTVYDTDDTTPLWDAAVTTTAGDPISQVDPS